MRVNCVGHQKGCHGVQSSSSVGIECYDPRGRPFSLGWRVSRFGRHCECKVEVSARSPFNSDAKLSGGGQILLCKPSALACVECFVEDMKTIRGHPNASAVRIVLLASGLLNPCLSRLERSRSAVGRRRFGLLDFKLLHALVEGWPDCFCLFWLPWWYPANLK
eukprot:747922-Pelagomonas_calceolata.AAC.1